MPGAPPGSSRSIAGYGASSGGSAATTSSCSAMRRTPSYGGASPTSPRAPSPGAPRPPTTAELPGSSTSKCWPPVLTPTELNALGYQPGGGRAAGSFRSPCSAYSASRSLTDRPRRSAVAASCSASTARMTTVRRTQSSLSQASPGVSDTLPPLWHITRQLLQRHVAAQDAVAEQAQTAQVGEARSLGKPGDHREVQRRVQA